MITRFIIAAVVIGLIVGGYFYGSDYLRDKKESEFRLYASVIAETSVAAELYRDSSDSFLVARDSILQKYGVTNEQMLAYKDDFSGDHHDWVRFWEIVSTITDSLADIQLDLIKQQQDSTAADSSAADSLMQI
jgi:hypothetical protein